MTTVQKSALLYILLMAAVFYGYAVGRFHVFPYAHIEPLVQDVLAFAKGDATEKKTSVVQKLKNDMGFSFDRWLFPYPAAATAQAFSAEFAGFSRRPEPPLVFIDPAHRSGYRVIAGAMQLTDTFWGALMLDPEGEIIHRWQLTTAHLSPDVKDQLKTLYGLHVFADGSIIFNMQEDGGGLVKMDACSNVLWNLEGQFHHAVSPDEHGYFWTFQGSQFSLDQDLARVSVDTGQIDRVIHMADVRAANPDLRIWELQDVAFKDVAKMRKSGNMTHGNDVDPLPSSIAAAFPGFSPDDLVVSYATTNLLFVLDPESLAIKWWRVGVTGFQHDPDWEADGRLVVFSNNLRLRDNAPSSIVAVNPETDEFDVILRGESMSFSSPINGQHELSPFGTRMVTSSRQGWAFELDGNNQMVFSFVNNVDAQKQLAMHLAAAWRFSEEYFDDEFWKKCSSNS